MVATSPHQLFLLVDHLKLSLLERQRAIALGLSANRQDAHLTRSLSNLQEGIDQLALSQLDLGQPEDSSSDLAKLRRQYEDLYSQFYGTAPPPSSSKIQSPNDPSLADDFAAAQSRPRSHKNVRFHDDPDAQDDAEAEANRAALFADSERYRDNPDDAAPDQSHLDNQQIHAYHTQALREQDEQLDSLSQSVGRQRMLGIQMGNELDDQNALLTDVESGVDRHVSTLDRARRNLGHVARKSKDNWSWVTIGILIVILVLLIVVLN